MGLCQHLWCEIKFSEIHINSSFVRTCFACVSWGFRAGFVRVSCSTCTSKETLNTGQKETVDYKKGRRLARTGEKIN